MSADKTAVVYDLANDASATVAGNDKGEIILFSTEAGREERRFSVRGVKSISDARLSPNGKMIGVLAWNKNDKLVAMLVDAQDGSIRLTRKSSGSESEPDFPTSVAFSADGTRFAVGRSLGAAEVWSTDPLREIERLPADKKEGNLLAFSKDGQFLVGGLRDTGVSLWNVATGRLIRTFTWGAFFASHVNVSSVALSHDGRLVAGALEEWARSSGDIGAERGIMVWDTATGKLLFDLRGHENGVAAVTFSPDDRWIISASLDGSIRYWDRTSGKSVAAFTSARDGRWMIITERGFFAGSVGSEDLINVVRGLDIYSVAQVYDSLYRPDLVEEVLKGDPEGKYKDAASKLNLETILDSGSAPQIEQVANRKTEFINDSAKVTVRLTNTGGGIGEKIVWRVNGVTQGEIRATGVQMTAGDGYRIISQTLRLDPAQRNIIEIIAYNGKGLLASLPYHLEIDKFGETTERPRMFIIAVGVSNYAKAEWNLQFAADDAKAIGAELQAVAKSLYADPKVVTVLEENATAKGIEAAIASIAGEVKAPDVFVLYIAGHGHSIAGTYYFLPQDLRFDGGRTIENAGISQDILQGWLARIPAQKSILILDTCESADAIRGDVEQETAIDRLQHATGRSIITAASDAAHEGYQGHGLLTETILEALTKTDGGDDEVTLRKLADYAYQKVPKISQDVWGERQQPHIKIADDFPLGARVAALAQPNIEETIPKSPTHVLIRAERVREQPANDAHGDQTLPPGAAVCVVKLVGEFSVIARDGVKLGYVPTNALAKLQ
jgi:Caspase domain/WD domain, G-beta repeat